MPSPTTRTGTPWNRSCCGPPAHAVVDDPTARKPLDRMRSLYAMSDASIEPAVFWRLTDNWLELSVRFVVPDRGVSSGQGRDQPRNPSPAWTPIRSRSLATYDILVRQDPNPQAAIGPSTEGRNDDSQEHFRTFPWQTGTVSGMVRRRKTACASGRVPRTAPTKYRDAFVWYDGDNRDNFTAYKLPIADVIDGELTAVPQAVMSAAGVVDGARGGVDVPDDGCGRIKGHLAGYYKKDGRHRLGRTTELSAHPCWGDVADWTHEHGPSSPATPASSVPRCYHFVLEATRHKCLVRCQERFMPLAQNDLPADRGARTSMAGWNWSPATSPAGIGYGSGH